MRDKCQTEEQLYIYEVAKTFWRIEQLEIKEQKFWLIADSKMIAFLPRTAHSRDVSRNFKRHRKKNQRKT